MKRNYILWKKATELQKAREYEVKLQKQGLIKDIKTYNKMLDEYASIRGFWNWNQMYEELQQ